MVLRKAFVAGERYALLTEDDDQELLPNELSMMEHLEPGGALYHFWLTLLLCHTVIANYDKQGNYSLQASSPDEEAFLQAGYDIGLKFVERTQSSLVLDLQGNRVEYELLCTNEFTSARKCMSTVVRTPEGKVLLFAKGAETAILPKLVDENSPEVQSAMECLDFYATEGLRTLCVAIRELDDWDETYAKEHADIENTLYNRKQMMEDFAQKIESDLVLQGITGIEDKLQDHVPETIRDLQLAGIKVWVLTGDKRETAVNIGYSAKLLQPHHTVLTIKKSTEEKCPKELDNCLETIENAPSTTQFALVMDGQSLEIALKKYDDILLELVTKCAAVLCCRMSPMQKSKVVALVKNSDEAPVTLAIGDGANDVSMILEADVGVGIYGKEGRQAVLSSDYSIAQFSFLKRLLLVHGRYSLLRVSALIQYSFYKNFTFTLPNVYYTIVSGFSGQTIFDSYLMMVFNVIYTSWPILLYSIFEKDVDEKKLMEYPQLYRRPQEGNMFSAATFGGWMLSVLWHSAVIYLGTVMMWSYGDLNANGQLGGIWTMGTICLTYCIVVVNLKIALETKYWTWMNHVGIWGSIIVYLGLNFPYTSIKLFEFTSPDNFYWVWFSILSYPAFYFGLIVIPITALLPDYIWHAFSRLVSPTDVQVIQEEDIFVEKGNGVKRDYRALSGSI
eukprot:TRINITY_DN2013_c2_g1_i5.p1 TRINITY_DN2013_c2_g1~~TRINITY_DN2013_c2_g1_i5.p1  ORF type:complete len:674 (-),score=223.60 TRINITY_DN2013_c2_g1_i5:1377-3398(-)